MSTVAACHTSMADMTALHQNPTQALSHSGDGNQHTGGTSICDAHFLSAEANKLTTAAMALAIVLFSTVVFHLFSLIKRELFRHSPPLGPPFDGHVRSHLGLGRIHI